jgi:hypothetical protein
MPERSKLSPPLKQLLSEPGRQGDAPLNALLATRTPLDEEQRRALEERGCQVRTVAGDVVTCTIPVSAVPEVEALPFIVAIEASRPLYPEGTDAGE